jgi:hypothetical protein
MRSRILAVGAVTAALAFGGAAFAVSGAGDTTDTPTETTTTTTTAMTTRSTTPGAHATEPCPLENLHRTFDAKEADIGRMRMA